MNSKVTQNLVDKIHSLLDKGLVSGIGIAVPGNMCIEAVISFALGEPHDGSPSCVGSLIGEFSRTLNDCPWSSHLKRAEGMRDLAIAQLGSDSLVQKEFKEKMQYLAITKLLPSMFSDYNKEKYSAYIKELENATELESATKAAVHVAHAAFFATDYLAAAAAYAAINDSCAYRTSYYIGQFKCPFYASPASAAYCAAEINANEDKYFLMVSHLAVSVLKDMKSPGCSFLKN